MPSWEIIVGIVVALGGVIGGLSGVAALIEARQNRSQIAVTAKKTDIEALSLIIDSLRTGYDRLKTENIELWVTVKRLERQVQLWRTRYCRLWEWARGCGLEPPKAMPEDEDEEDE